MRSIVKRILIAMMAICAIQLSADVPTPPPAPTGNHSIAICTSGTLIGFGNNNSCQLGNGSSSSNVDPPIASTSLTNVVATSTGGGHTLVLKDDGSVWVWGYNNLGQSAQSGTADVCTPAQVSSLGCAVAVSAGNAFSMALMADGTIYTWGSNSNGQLGSGSMSPSSRYTPALVSGITNAIAISAGYSHAMALLDDGTVKVWGFGPDGQIGNNTTTTNNPTPQSASITGVVKIEAGGNHNLALQNTGKLYVWGDNQKGQLGLSDYTDRLVPASSSISSGTIIDMAAGLDHTIILNSNGTLRVCGHNARHQLGICSGTMYNTGQSGPAISGIVDVQTSSSFDHNLAVTSSGALYTWGNNDDGQLGVGSGSGYLCTPQHVNYSGSGVCTVKPSVDFQPQPCCVAIQDEGRITLEGTYASGSLINYTGQNLAITGPIILTNGTHYLTNCNVVCEDDASITINSGARLIIQSASHLYACGNMWHGIDVKTNGRISVLSSSLIEDAEVAVDVEYGAQYSINTAIFNKNYTHFYKHMPSGSVGSYTSDYVIVKSKFLCQTTASIGGTPVHTTLLAPHAGQRTDVALMAVGVPKLLVGNTNAANANTVDNANWGIFDWTVGRVQVMHNTIRDIGNGGVYAVYGPGAGGETIDIIDNDFLRMPYPVFCHDNTKTVRTHVNYNNIDFAGMASPPATMVGITVSEVTPATGDVATDNFNYVDVSHNIVSNAPCGINLINLKGDLVGGGVAKLYVGDNTITHAKNVSYGDGAGIKTNNVSQAAISNNIIGSPPPGASNWWENAIRISGGNELAITCNQTSTLGKGLFFDNDVRPLTVVAVNDMTGHDAGIFLNYSIIGSQGTMADPNDNEWLGSWTGKNHIECYGSSSYGPDSPFTVRSTGSTYYPTNRAGTTGGFPVPAPSTTADTWSFGCQFVNPSFKTDGETASPTSEGLGMIAESGQPLTEREQAMRWNGHYGLYKQLLRDEQLAGADEGLATFFADRDGGSMGSLHRALGLFGQLRQGSGSSESAIAVLESVIPENRPEQTLKEVLGALIPNAADLRLMDSEQEGLLRDVAKRCPIDDGFGVYIARAALISIDTLPKDYTSECEQVPSDEEVSEKQRLEESSGFAVHPNPTNGFVTLTYSMEVGDSGEVFVYDITGGLVLQEALSEQASYTSLDLTKLTAGLYLIRVDVNGQTELLSRVSVLGL